MRMTQRLKTIPRAPTGALLAAALVVLAGCISPSPESPETGLHTPSEGNGSADQDSGNTGPTINLEPQAAQDDEVPIRIQWPTMINATPPSGEVQLRIRQYDRGDDCRELQEYALKVRLYLYDRDGLRWETFYRFDLDEDNETFTIPVDGAPPYILVGDWNSCLTDETLGGALSTWQPHATEFRYVDRLWFNLTVPLGDNTTTIEWKPTARVTGLFQARPSPDHRQGHRYGQVHLESSSEGRVCTDTFSLLGGWDADCTPFILYPGTFDIVLELDMPAVQETTWAYFMDVDRFHEGVCDHGFEWEGLCN